MASSSARTGGKRLSKLEVHQLPTQRYRRNSNRKNIQGSCSNLNLSDGNLIDQVFENKNCKSNLSPFIDTPKRQNYKKKIYRDGKDTVTWEEWVETRPLSKSSFFKSTPDLSNYNKNNKDRGNKSETDYIYKPQTNNSFKNAPSASASLNDDDVLKCSICQEYYEEDDDLKSLPCFHNFHSACIDRWIMMVSKGFMICT